MSRTTLTDVKLRKLKPDRQRRVEIWDAQLPGFGVRVSKAGTKSFVLLYRLHGRSRRMTLGRYPVLSLAAARVRARQALNVVAGGADPQADANTETGTKSATRAEAKLRYRFKDVVGEFVAKHCGRNNRASTARETERLLRAFFVSQWPARDIRQITRTNILAVLDAIVDAGKPSSANHALAAVRKFFNWAHERGLVETSPCLGIKMPARTSSRSRLLGEDELAKVWLAAEAVDFPFSAIVRILILTGQRRGEVASMRWSDVDIVSALWTIPPEFNKSGRAHSVPLTATVIDILNFAPRLSNSFVFPSLRSPERTFSGFSKCKARLDRMSGVTDWTLHDLRRTFATGLAKQSVPPHIVEKLLNYSTGTLGGVAGIYNRFGYVEDMRKALAAWEKYLFQLLSEMALDDSPAT